MTLPFNEGKERWIVAGSLQLMMNRFGPEKIPAPLSAQIGCRQHLRNTRPETSITAGAAAPAGPTAPSITLNKGAPARFKDGCVNFKGS